MAQRKPEEQVTVEQVLQLVDQLTPEGVLELRRQLDSRTWGDRFKQLVQEVAEDTKDQAPLTEEEIAQEVTDYRREKRAQSA
jgi:hypothetical protein